MNSTSRTQWPLVSVWRWATTVLQPARGMPARWKPRSRRRLQTADTGWYQTCLQLCLGRHRQSQRKGTVDP